MIDASIIDSWRLSTAWRHGLLTLSEFADKAIELMGELRVFESRFESFKVMDLVGLRYLALPEDREAAHALFMDLAWSRKARLAFDPMNETDESPYPNSTAALGYSLNFLTHRDEHSPNSIEISLSAGVTDNLTGNGCVVDFERPTIPSSPLFQRQLLVRLMRVFPVDSAFVTSDGFLKALQVRDQVQFKRIDVQPMFIGWLTYMRRAGVAEALPPGTAAEPFGEPPGVLYSLDGEQTPMPTDAQVEQAIRIREALTAAGVGGDPAITPRDEIKRDNRRPRKRGGYSE